MKKDKKTKKPVGRPKKRKDIEVLNVGYMDISDIPVPVSAPKYSNYVECIMDLFINLGLKTFMKEQMNLLGMTYVQFYTNKYLSEMVNSEIQLFYKGRVDFDTLKNDIKILCENYKFTISP